MKKNEADRIIENYKPHSGFHDLSKKPNSLTEMEYAKLLKAQGYLAWQEGNKKYLMEFEPTQWQDMKGLSMDFQAIVRKHWDVNKL